MRASAAEPPSSASPPSRAGSLRPTSGAEVALAGRDGRLDAPAISPGAAGPTSAAVPSRRKSGFCGEEGELLGALRRHRDAVLVAQPRLLAGDVGTGIAEGAVRIDEAVPDVDELAADAGGRLAVDLVEGRHVGAHPVELEGGHADPDERHVLLRRSPSPGHRRGGHIRAAHSSVPGDKVVEPIVIGWRSLEPSMTTTAAGFFSSISGPILCDPVEMVGAHEAGRAVRGVLDAGRRDWPPGHRSRPPASEPAMKVADDEDGLGVALFSTGAASSVARRAPAAPAAPAAAARARRGRALRAAALGGAALALGLARLGLALRLIAARRIDRRASAARRTLGEPNSMSMMVRGRSCAAAARTAGREAASRAAADDAAASGQRRGEAASAADRPSPPPLRFVMSGSVPPQEIEQAPWRRCRRHRRPPASDRT